MDDVDKEAAKFFEQEKEKAVNALQEALNIDRILKACLEYIDKGFLQMEMPLIEALEKLEKRKFELIEIDPEEEQEDEWAAKVTWRLYLISISNFARKALIVFSISLPIFSSVNVRSSA